MRKNIVTSGAFTSRNSSQYVWSKPITTASAISVYVDPQRFVEHSEPFKVAELLKPAARGSKYKVYIAHAELL